jgi:AraC family transcriptional regulator of adaptative response / DNA-3-methyladenine glycosylase II
MELNHERCYSVIKSRDERFDGRFFTAVLTTGIYCRPVCPATTPRPENVRFFATAAAAAEAGFRPCLRCRPESAPGSPEWDGASALVSRAMRLIGEEVMNEGGVDAVAAHLHVSARQLRRLFAQHVGVPPIAVLQTRRIHFAKKLLDETGLSMTDIAFAAGFGSIRRFNDAIYQTYGRSPTELRRQNSPEDTENSHLQLKLAYRPPFDWHSLIQFFQARATPGVEEVKNDSYQRTVRFGAIAGTIQVHHHPAKQQLWLQVPVHLSRHVQTIVQRVRRLFDLQADPLQIAAHLRQFPLLAPAITANPGLRLPGSWAGFELSVRAILGQQVSVPAATTLCGRLVKRAGTPLTVVYPRSTLTHLYPTPDQLVAADLSDLGITQQRIIAIQTMAQAVVDGHLSFTTATSLDDIVAQLMAFPGVGSWTAQYIAMRAFGEPDAFPASDLILRRMAAPPGETLTAAQCRRIAEPWRPWRAYAAVMLWRQATTTQLEKTT